MLSNLLRLVAEQNSTPQRQGESGSLRLSGARTLLYIVVWRRRTKRARWQSSVTHKPTSQPASISRGRYWAIKLVEGGFICTCEQGNAGCHPHFSYCWWGRSVVVALAMFSDWTLSITRPYGDPAPSVTTKNCTKLVIIVQNWSILRYGSKKYQNKF